MHLLVVNGPNLNLLGSREPHLYGARTLADIEAELAALAARHAARLSFFQSNHEGELLDRLQAARGKVDGIIINPGGLGHTSVCLRDCLAALGLPVIEVHLTNIHAREEFRRTSLISGVCRAVICGLGPLGYRHALEAFLASAPAAGTKVAPAARPLPASAERSPGGTKARSGPSSTSQPPVLAPSSPARRPAASPSLPAGAPPSPRSPRRRN